jgi:thioredoxin reductase
VPGLHTAGDVGGGALIRNALEEGARVAREIAALPRAAGDALDLLIVGAGPAGLSAALEARALGLRHLALEQGTIADGIRSFPRGKLVMDSDLPVASRLWLAEATKEELLARWMRTVRAERPQVREGARVTRITRDGDGFGFSVEAIDPTGVHTYRAARVLLAIGRRGTPRKLDAGIPDAMIDHVHYSLADARSFAGQRVLVVGLGDVAMEAAIARSQQPGTQVAIAARAADFTRGKARTIDEVRRRAAAGTLAVHWRSEVAAVAPGRVTLATPDGPRDLACDSVFVLIGALPAEDLLRATGLIPQIEPPPRALGSEEAVP